MALFSELPNSGSTPIIILVFWNWCLQDFSIALNSNSNYLSKVAPICNVDLALAYVNENPLKIPKIYTLLWAYQVYLA